jgi:hypothetical protein
MTDKGPETTPPDVAELLAQLPSGAVVDVHRWRLDGPRPRYAYVGRLDAADYTPELLAARWGAGDYRLYIRVPAEAAKSSGIPQLIVREVSIDEAAAPQRPAPASPPAPAPQPVDIPSGVAQLVALQAQALQALVESVRQMVRAPEHDPLRDVMLELVKARISGQEKPEWSAMWEIFREGMEAARASNGGGSSALERLGLKFAELLERAQQRPSPPAQLPASPPAGAAPNAPPSWRRYLDGIRPLCLQAAAADASPGLYAELLAQHLPAELDAEVDALMASPAWPENVIEQLSPEWGPARDWLRRVLVQFRAQFTEAPGEAPDA